MSFTKFAQSLLLSFVGMAALLASRPAHAQAETVLYSFTGGSDGANPDSRLTADSKGNFYGTTGDGGTFGAGTVFELSPNGSGGWRETVLYSFSGVADGGGPSDPVIFDNLGNLYGTADYGGVDLYGVAFELSPVGASWKETVLYNFSCCDVADPVNGLIMDAAGNLYGTAGTNSAGSVFELSPSAGGWTEQMISGYDAGALSGLTMDGAGNIFFPRGPNIVELSPNGDGVWNSTSIYVFPNKSVDPYAQSTLVFDQAGNLYGTTTYGGGRRAGTVFKLTRGKKAWTGKTLYIFKGGEDGGYPVGGVVLDAAGNIYGTTSVGGKSDGGTVFELAAPVGEGDYQKKILQNFDYRNGYVPMSSLILDSAGNLYGTTPFGGSIGFGVVFELTP